jgi:hypothetical protein
MSKLPSADSELETVAIEWLVKFDAVDDPEKIWWKFRILLCPDGPLRGDTPCSAVSSAHGVPVRAARTGTYWRVLSNAHGSTPGPP